ncbi:predicted protein [Nematostella vectensis]|uniref:Saposin B-type domain-containing protein n=1 Tax=Nematostella vectensis TaxID=45351 RepID=A7SAR1_NEMVE|nr:predicted protein [Nematostella vectensis]|eukprot:XP_001631229.1 predicted protein [Nematostella vectensis]
MAPSLFDIIAEVTGESISEALRLVAPQTIVSASFPINAWSASASDQQIVDQVKPSNTAPSTQLREPTPPVPHASVAATWLQPDVGKMQDKFTTAAIGVAPTSAQLRDATPPLPQESIAATWSKLDVRKAQKEFTTAAIGVAPTPVQPVACVTQELLRQEFLQPLGSTPTQASGLSNLIPYGLNQESAASHPCPPSQQSAPAPGNIQEGQGQGLVELPPKGPPPMQSNLTSAGEPGIGSLPNLLNPAQAQGINKLPVSQPTTSGQQNLSSIQEGGPGVGSASPIQEEKAPPLNPLTSSKPLQPLKVQVEVSGRPQAQGQNTSFGMTLNTKFSMNNTRIGESTGNSVGLLNKVVSSALQNLITMLPANVLGAGSTGQPGNLGIQQFNATGSQQDATAPLRGLGKSIAQGQVANPSQKDATSMQLPGVPQMKLFDNSSALQENATNSQAATSPLSNELQAQQSSATQPQQETSVQPADKGGTKEQSASTTPQEMPEVLGEQLQQGQYNPGAQQLAATLPQQSGTLITDNHGADNAVQTQAQQVATQSQAGAVNSSTFVDRPLAGAQPEAAQQTASKTVEADSSRANETMTTLNNKVAPLNAIIQVSQGPNNTSLKLKPLDAVNLLQNLMHSVSMQGKPNESEVKNWLTKQPGLLEVHRAQKTRNGGKNDSKTIRVEQKKNETMAKGNQMSNMRPGDENCDLCRFVMEFLNRSLPDPTTVNDIYEQIKTSCPQLTPQTRKDCEDFLDNHGHQLQHAFFYGRRTEDTCVDLALCWPKYWSH